MRAEHAGRESAHSSGHSSGRVPFALLVGGLIVGALALLLALNTASAANELRRHGLAARDNAVAASVQDYQVRVAASAAPGNLARAADELGMVPAGNPAFVVIGADGRAKVMGKPGAVTEAPIPAPHTPKPKPSPTTSASTTSASTTARPSGTSRPTSTRPARSATPTPTPRPTPTSTPTPTVTLPGGVR